MKAKKTKTSSNTFKYNEVKTKTIFSEILKKFAANRDVLLEGIDMPPIEFCGAEKRVGDKLLERLIGKLKPAIPNHQELQITGRYWRRRNQGIITVTKLTGDAPKSGEAQPLDGLEIQRRFHDIANWVEENMAGAEKPPEVHLVKIIPEALLEFGILTASERDLCLIISHGQTTLKAVSPTTLRDPENDTDWMEKADDEDEEMKRYTQAMRCLVYDATMPHITFGAMNAMVETKITTTAAKFSLKTVAMHVGDNKRVLVYRDIDPKQVIALNVVKTPLKLDRSIPRHEEILPTIIQLFKTSLSGNAPKPRPIYLSNLSRDAVSSILKEFEEDPRVVVTIRGQHVKLERADPPPDGDLPATLNLTEQEARALVTREGTMPKWLPALSPNSRQVVYEEADRLGLVAYAEAGIEVDRRVLLRHPRGSAEATTASQAAGKKFVNDILQLYINRPTTERDRSRSPSTHLDDVTAADCVAAV